MRGGRASRQRSVRQLLLSLVVAGTGLVLLVGLAGALTAHFSAAAVDTLTEQVNPAVKANEVTYQDLLIAQAAVRSFATSGDRAQLDPYRSVVARLDRDLATLRRYGGPGSQIRRNAGDLRDAARGWVDGYAEPRIARGGGEGTYRPRLFRTGLRLFGEVAAAHAALAERLDAEYDATQSDSRTRSEAAFGLVVGAALLGGLVLALLGWWVMQEVRRPLSALERVVGRLAAGDHRARVVPSGPREIRSVGLALNELAEESDRGREVEAAIQSQLREVDAAKSDFVSNVSHELRTPLTIITGYLELLDEELSGRLDDEQARMLDVTARNVRRLRALIEDLLTLDRAEHSGTTLEQADLRATVDAVVSDMRLSAGNRSIQLVVRTPPEPVIALVDASQLHRAVLNVVSNAVKFSPDGSPVDVDLHLHGGNEAQLVVVDRGMGIPKAELPKLGARFFRASNAVRSEVGGTGLGLRIVQTIVMNHHGTLTVDSVEGAGTTVRITLPLRPQLPPAREETADLPG